MAERFDGPKICVTLNLPIDLVQALYDNRIAISDALRKALLDHERNPPPDIAAERNAARQDRLEEAERRLRNTGRFGYRLLRDKEAELRANGDAVPKGAARQKWHKQVLRGVAAKAGADYGYLDIATTRFRQEFAVRLKLRRRREFLRLARQGQSNIQIGSRYSLSPQTVSKHLKAALQESPKTSGRRGGVNG